MSSASSSGIRSAHGPQRIALIVAYLAIVLVQLLQSPGRTTFDTKLDLVVDPGQFLSRSLDLWSSQVGMGELQNQAYGYLFPIGPVFWVAHAVAVPPWLVERLWSAAVMLVAFEGVRRLARAWGGLGPGCAILAATAYVAAPRFLTLVGGLTGELLPTALVPWAVLPLVLARQGRLDVYAASLLSGVAVLLMGGQNAVVTAATLPLPAVLVVHAVWRGELPKRALLTWTAAVAAACAWWAGPLLLLGRYSAPFLDVIESAANTTAPLSWVNAVRGADHWVAFVSVGGQPWWPAGYALATSSWLVVVTAVVAGLSLAGLAGRSVPNRACLTVPLLIGVICLVAAHGTAAGGLAAEQLRSWLDGPLAPLRNVHKVDPLVRLPLALGFGYLARDLGAVVTPAIARMAGLASRAATAAGSRVAAGAVVVLVISAQPALAGDLRQQPGWSELPQAWVHAGRIIDELPAGSRVLVVPASGFGLQVWGTTIDEPLQASTAGSWVSRGQAPLVPGANVRLLDSLESMLASGAGSSALAQAIARCGITHVLVRTDLDATASDAPSPALVRDALASTPGMALLRSFGTPPGAALPMQLWRVPRPGGADPRVSAVPVADARVVAGGPEAMLPLLADGLLAPTAPGLLAGSGAAPATAPVDVLTDTLQRREQAFGRVHDAASSILAADDDFRQERAAHTYAAFAGAQHTVAFYPGLSSVAATSSQGYVDILGPVLPERGPYSALDSDSETAWVTAPYTDPVGQSLTIALRTPTVLTTIPVRLWNGPGQPAVTALALRTDNGAVTIPVPPFSDMVDLPVPAGPTTTLRFTVAAVDASRGSTQVGIADIRLGGVDASRTLVVPAAADPSTHLVFAAAPPRRACSYPERRCDVAGARPAEEAAALDRTFTVAGSGRWDLSIEAVARPSTATARLLGPVAAGYATTGSSELAGDPAVAPAFAIDGDPLTSWVTDPRDRSPELTLRVPREVTLRRLQIGLGTQPDVRRPTAVRIRSGSETRWVSTLPDSLGFFRPLRTDAMSLTFFAGRRSRLAPYGLPMEISELALTGLGSAHYAPSPASRTGQPCGFGPPVFLDGARFETRVAGTIGDVLDGTSLSVSLCRPGSLALAAGPHRIRVASTAQFQAVQVRLDPAPAPAEAPATGVPRQVDVHSWSNSSRTVRVAAGPAALLWVPENTNPGWVASVDDRELEAVIIDGWAQGWRLPAGDAVTVQLTYRPQRTYVAVLLAGSLLSLGLLVAAVVSWRRRRIAPLETVDSRLSRGKPRSRRSAALTRAGGWLALLVAAALAGGGLLVGAGAGLLADRGGDGVRRLLVAAATVAAAGWQVAAGGDALAADLLAAAAVGIVVAPSWPATRRSAGVAAAEPQP